MVVTGAAGGIGRPLVLHAGASVVATDLRAEGLSSVAEELGDGHSTAVCNVADEAAFTSFLRPAEAAVGGVDIFIGNAGVAIGGEPVGTPDDVWDLAFDVNVRQRVAAARNLLPAWLERGEGYFVSVASAAGLLTQIGPAPYAVSKHAAVAFAEWLSVTYGSRGLRVSCACPMGVDP